jgi:uncharacterized protein YbjT (DUF2867 family)
MILITGATGTVGREVVTRLSAQGLEVRVEYVQGDFEDLESMRRACAGVDRAFLLTDSTERTDVEDVGTRTVMGFLRPSVETRRARVRVY